MATIAITQEIKPWRNIQNILNLHEFHKNFLQCDTNSTCETFIIKRFVADYVAGKINKNKNDFILAMTLFLFHQLLPTKVIIGYSHV